MDLCQEPRLKSQMYVMRALCRQNLGNYQLALADYKTADSILAVKYPQSEDNRVRILPLRAGTEYKLGHIDEAERLYRLYAEQIGLLYGEQSLTYVHALTYLANVKGFIGHLDSGCQIYTEAMLGLRRILKTQSPYMTADEREALWSPLSPLLANMTPYAIKADRCQTPFTVSCYDALIMSKAFLLESECSLADVVRREGTDQDVADYLRLSLMKKQIQDWERNYALYADSLLELNRTADQLAAHLAERCLSFADQTGFMDIDYAAVKQALKKKEVLIDFTDYVSKTQGRQYAAYIIRKKDDYPLLKHLFAERQIDLLGIVRPDMYYDQDYAPDVLNILWEPLKKYVAEGSTVYYVPSQLLFEVALESLPLPDGSLLGDHYKFVRLSSTRELVRTYAPTLSADGASAVLYGGLQYDLQAETMVAQAKQYDVSNLLVMRGADVRGDSLYPLPGTRVEVMAIDSILRANRWQVQCRMDKNGTEESFLSMHGHSPRVLQIATHGFYYTPARAASVDYLKGYTDALSLSGLILSGANTVWCGREVPEGVQDGILTGSEVARLDLSGTDMVVLSACQSAQGQATSEGLYGLQRAFKKAGVGTMVLTLWKVRDAVACEFMKTFYNQLASAACRWNKHKAFDRAKAIIRAQYPDPFCWAAFVMLD
ncbi:MAG: CHAT domain-containing protein [Bacteroidales bacterium]|nr:CHAT domain-containing protein [Bacteroidales bacterium]